MTAALTPREPTILVVDDDPLLRELAARVLRRGGYVVIEAADGLEALAHCKGTGLIDLVVTDVRMPRLDGLRMAAACGAHRPNLPFLFMSGDADPATLSGPLLAKPFGPAKLAATVRELLTREGLGREGTTE
ncbi:MAG: response regulator [Gemmatimonadales bacterium]|nr:response regulator [Gemmatimonadales bacterium]